MRAPVYGLTVASLIAISSTSEAENSPYVELQDDRLLQGRAIWLDNCEGCHGYGIAGAPVPMHPSDWAARLTKGKAVLYKHAINGYFGPDDTMMPERGGNPALTDVEVTLAVDYMAALANHYIQLKRKTK